MKVIVGLGNYNRKYFNTRHNVGFSIIDAYAETKHISFKGSSFNGQIAHFLSLSKEKVFLVKPTTMMNLSGNCVQSLMRFYHLSCDDILIIHDDLELSVGQYKIKTNSSHGGHNGVKDIMEKVRSKNFYRMKIGIGRPVDQTVIEYVLGQFDYREQETIALLHPQLFVFLDLWISFPPVLALNKFAVWKSQNEKKE